MRLSALLGAAAAFVVVVLFGASPVTRTDFPLDDAWIHLDYARGLLRDGLPTYNPGEPEAGFSSPLWLPLAVVGLLVAKLSGLPVALAVKGVAAALGAAASAVLARCMARAGASTAVAVVASVAAPLGPWWCAGAASGMEVTLTALTLALALGAAQEDRPRRLGAFLALAILARPECAAGALALIAWQGVTNPADRLRRVGLLAIPSAVAVGLWVAYDLAVTGHPLPNTFYAKAGRPELGTSVAIAARTVTEDGTVAALLLLALAAVGLRRARVTAPAAAAAWVALAVVPAVGVLASRPFDPSVLLYSRRYLYPFLMLLWWPAALGVQHIADAIPRRPRWLPAAALLLVATAVAPSLLAARALHADQCQDIATFHTGPARAVAANTPADAVVAVEGAGAARFFAGRTVVDLVGLNEHALIRHRRGTTAHLCHLLRVRRPTWFVMPAAWVPRFAPAWAFTWHGAVRSNRYAQLEPPRRHEVVILSAAPRPEALARCGLSAPRAASPAPPTAP